MRVDLISRNQPPPTAGTSAKPGRAATFWDIGKTGTRCDLGRNEFLSAPGPNDDIGARGDHGLGRYDAILGVLALGELGEHIDSAGGLDQFRYPGYAGDHGFVPLFEIDARPARQPECAFMHGV